MTDPDPERYRHIPAPVRLEDTVAVKETDPVPDPARVASVQADLRAALIDVRHASGDPGFIAAAEPGQLRVRFDTRPGAARLTLLSHGAG